MKFLKWLLHPAVVLIAIVAIAIYINRQPEHSDKPAVSTEQVAAPSTPVQEESSNEAPAEGAPSIAEPMDKPEQGEQGAVALADIPAPPAMSSVDSIEPPAAETEATTELEVLQNEAAAQAPVAAVTATVTVDETEAMPSMMAEKANDVASLVYQARQAAWQGRVDEAIGLYEQASQQQPDNIDLHGELGDLYLQANNIDKAVEAYSTAASLLNEANEPMRAWAVVDYMRSFAPDAALALGDRLFLNK